MSWSLELPTTVSFVDEVDGVFTFEPDAGFGALQLSSYIKDQTVTDDDLVEFLEGMLGQDQNLIEVMQGEFTGFIVETNEDKSWFRYWFLKCSSTMVLATYNCDFGARGREDRLVDGVLSTLTYSQQ